jgi:hypothetical protein
MDKAAWDARAVALSRMKKTQLIRMYRNGIRRPDGTMAAYGGGMHPPEKWRKDEIVGSILGIEFPGDAGE